jgi:hypothetical protein
MLFYSVLCCFSPHCRVAVFELLKIKRFYGEFNLDQTVGMHKNNVDSRVKFDEEGYKIELSS